MNPQDILAHDALRLSPVQREAYFRDGFVAAERVVPMDWIERLRAATDELLEESRGVSASNDRFDLGPDHSADSPRPRRVRAAVDQHPVYWEFATSDVMTDIAADLVGPDVKFHSSKLNFKWPRGGDEVKWHQDIPAWPHTDYSPVTIGVYLEDVGTEQGPLAFVPGSQDGPLFDHIGPDGTWKGYINDKDMKALAMDTVVDATGPAGSVVALNCRVVHGSRVNNSGLPRSLLLFVYSSADSFPITAAPTPTSHTGDIVRGVRARFANVDPRPPRIPPDWAKEGYVSIYASQKHETRARA